MVLKLICEGIPTIRRWSALFRCNTKGGPLNEVL